MATNVTNLIEVGITVIGSAICKDCGNGTMNNVVLERFLFDEVNGIYCAQCGGNHIDGELEVAS